METDIDALNRLADGLHRVADEMAIERRTLARQLVALTWHGVAAEAVRGALGQRVCSLADARERYLEAAGALDDHVDRVQSRRALVAHAADRIEALFS